MSSRDLLKHHDRDFADFARSLEPAEWTQPSLCSTWSTHDVLAHLVVGCSISVPRLGWALAKDRASFDTINTVLAQSLSCQRSPQELLASFETLIDRRRGIGTLFPPALLLGDHVIHHLDIALALGKPAAVDRETVNAVLDTEVGLANPFVPAKRNASGLLLRTTDTDWTFTGDHGGLGMVEGRAVHLASALAGRRHALAFLVGDGVAALAARITSPDDRRHRR